MLDINRKRTGDGKVIVKLSPSQGASCYPADLPAGRQGYSLNRFDFTLKNPPIVWGI